MADILAQRTPTGRPKFVLIGAPGALGLKLSEIGWQQWSMGRWTTTRPATIAATDALLPTVRDESCTRALAWCSRAYRDSSVMAYPGGGGPEVEEVLAKGAPKPFPYQASGAIWLAGKQRALLGDDAGCGKTNQALIACAIVNAKRVLVLCPTTLTGQWIDEADRWVGLERFDEFQAVGFGLLSTSGERAGETYFDAVFREKWDVVIIDECHYLRSMDSTRTCRIWGGQSIKNKIIKGKHRRVKGPKFEGIAHVATRVWALSGSPIPNKPKNMLPTLHGLDPEGWPTQQYLERYCDPRFDRATNAIVYEGSSNEEELNKNLRGGGIMLRRLKADVLPQLPPKVRGVVRLEVTNLTRETEFLKSNRLTLADIREAVGRIGALCNADDVLATVRQQSSLARVVKMVPMIQALAGDESVLVLCNHREVAWQLHASLHSARNEGADDARDCEAMSLTGDDAPAERRAKALAFTGKYLCATIGAIGTGLDGLQRAYSHAIFVEFPWAPSDLTQAEDRLHRIGQTKSVRITYLVEPGSIESAVLAGTARKAEWSHMVLDASVQRTNVSV